MWQRFWTKAGRQPMEQGLAKTRSGLRDRLAGLMAASELGDDTWADLEAALVASDVGLPTTRQLIEALQRQARQGKLRRLEEVPQALRGAMLAALSADGEAEVEPVGRTTAPEHPYVILVVGVNGSGKTTTVAKLGRWLQRQGRAVLLVAADTYRAAALEQLRTWAESLKLPLASAGPGADPGAVVYDALHSRHGRSADAIVIDTAGRLHTQQNLMAELRKVRSVIERALPGAPHETLLVLDATTGQNGLAQARAFREAVGITGLVLAKLDSSARGGVALAVHRELGTPIRFVGVGEGADDLLPFDAQTFVAGLIGDAVGG